MPHPYDSRFLNSPKPLLFIFMRTTCYISCPFRLWNPENDITNRNLRDSKDSYQSNTYYCHISPYFISYRSLYLSDTLLLFRIGFSFVPAVVVWEILASVTILLRQMLKTMDESRQPCIALTVVRTHSTMLSFSSTALVASLDRYSGWC